MEMIVSTFYKYIEVKENLEKFRLRHLRYSRKKGIKGKILISIEGINGAISGTKEQVEMYKKYLRKNQHFNNIIFKDTKSSVEPYKRMLVKVRKEIITSNLNIDIKNKGGYITPKELNNSLDKEEDIILVDARNDYETKVGKFRNAIDLDIHEFQDFKKRINWLEKLKDKKIVMYCTGGVRCEKASAFLREKGFKNIFQLEGGIINYINQFPNSYFDGRCFVFDARISISSGEESKEISICELCHAPSKRVINCISNKCNRSFICCEDCEKVFKHACSKQCKISNN